MQLHTWSEGIQFDKVIYNWPVTKFLTNVDKGRKWHHDVASAHFYRCADSSIFWLARMTSICLDVTYIPATMSEGTSFGDWSIDYIIKMIYYCVIHVQAWFIHWNSAVWEEEGFSSVFPTDLKTEHYLAWLSGYIQCVTSVQLARKQSWQGILPFQDKGAPRDEWSRM